MSPMLWLGRGRGVGAAGPARARDIAQLVHMATRYGEARQRLGELHEWRRALEAAA